MEDNVRDTLTEDDATDARRLALANGVAGEPMRSASKPAKTSAEKPLEASASQLKRARKFLAGNPITAGALGVMTKPKLNSLALSLPLSRHERQNMRLQAKTEGKRSTIADPIRVRNQTPVAHPLAVQRWLETVPAAANANTADELVAAMGAGLGLTAEGVERVGRRVGRFVASCERAGLRRRLPRHVRDAAVLSSAAIQAIVIRFPDAASDDMRLAVSATAQLAQAA